MSRATRYGDDRKKVQRQVWHLMMWTASGWVPSMDYPIGWRTKKAAFGKIRELGERGKGYIAMRYRYVP